MNMQLLLLMSGPVAVGKSGVARQLVAEHGFQRIGTGDLLRVHLEKEGLSKSRTDLQGLGDRFDEETDFYWVVQRADEAIAAFEAQQVWILDAVRKTRQVEHFRKKFGDAVVHVHFVAPEEVLRERYEQRLAAGGEYVGNTTYEEAICHPNEIAARSLEELADYVVDLTAMMPLEAAAHVARLTKG